MGDMVLSRDQLQMFKNGHDVSRSYHTDWLWKENWSAIQDKYLIPFKVHPVQEAQECFRFQLRPRLDNLT